MENPSSWGEAERVVHQAMRAWDEANRAGMCGLSVVRCVTDALREAGLLRPEWTPGSGPEATYMACAAQELDKAMLSADPAERATRRRIVTNLLSAASSSTSPCDEGSVFGEDCGDSWLDALERASTRAAEAK